MFTRGDDPARYHVAVFLPDARHETELVLAEDETRAQPPVPDAWAHAEVLKIARVLKKNPRPSLSRWRGRPDEGASG